MQSLARKPNVRRDSEQVSEDADEDIQIQTLPDPRYVLRNIFRLPLALRPNGDLRGDFIIIDQAEGDILWNASTVFLRLLEEKFANFFRGKTVLELGSGLGHLGFELQNRFEATVICTEQAHCVPKLKASLRAQKHYYLGGSSSSTAEMLRPPSTREVSNNAVPAEDAPEAVLPEVCTLDWGGEALPEHLQSRKIDVIVGCDLIYNEGVHDLLVTTLEQVLPKDPTEERRDRSKITVFS